MDVRANRPARKSEAVAVTAAGIDADDLRQPFNWPTWLVAVAVYGGWAALTWNYEEVPLWLLPVLGGWFVAWHGSFQHEAVHGQPSRSALFNEILASPPVGLWMPYPLYRETHIRHHMTADLTHPETDPESFYVSSDLWHGLPRPVRRVLLFNHTLLGRLVIGPALASGGLWVAEVKRIMAGDGAALRVWLVHLGSVAAVLAWVMGVCGMPFWVYVVGFAYPGLSLILLRSYLEHRPADVFHERTVIVEGGMAMAALYLNNNLHALHHARTDLPWYALPMAYRQSRDAVLAANGGYRFESYGHVIRRYLLTPKDSPVHPG